MPKKGKDMLFPNDSEIIYYSEQEIKETIVPLIEEANKYPPAMKLILKKYLNSILEELNLGEMKE